MDRDELLKHISADPRVCFGKPCIRGTRIWVSLVLGLLAGGMSEAELIEEYGLTHDHIRAALAYGAAAAAEKFIPIPLERAAG